MESKQTIKLHCLENRVASGYVTFGSYWEKGMNKANIATIFIDVHANTEFHFILILMLIATLCLYR